MHAATIRQAVLLVGGLGTRLGALTASMPKPMLAVGGRPFLYWPLRELSRYGVEEVVLLAGHLSAQLRAGLDELAAMLPRPLRIVVSEEPASAGTGGALLHAAAKLDARFLLLNGDSWLDCNLAALLAASRGDGPEVIGRMVVRRVPDAARYGAVALADGVVTGFADRGAAGPGDINAGIAVYRREILGMLAANCSLERDVLPGLAAAGRLRGQRAEGYFIDIGIPADLEAAQTGLPAALSRPALLLDRDGTLNVDHGWVGTPERFEFMPGAVEAVRMATAAGWHVFVVTNQSGIARGLYSEAQMQALHAGMADAMRAAGGTIDDIRFCPYHPEAKIDAYRRVSDWRKPGPGMVLDLLRAWRLDPARCVLVGDQPTDMQAAAAAGVAGRLFPGGDLAAFVAPLLAG